MGRIEQHTVAQPVKVSFISDIVQDGCDWGQQRGQQTHHNQDNVYILELA